MDADGKLVAVSRWDGDVLFVEAWNGFRKQIEQRLLTELGPFAQRLDVPVGRRWRVGLEELDEDQHDSGKTRNICVLVLTYCCELRVEGSKFRHVRRRHDCGEGNSCEALASAGIIMYETANLLD